MNKETFLSDYPNYVHSEHLDQLRKKEFDRLDAAGHIYLDYTGGNLYPKSLLETHCLRLKEGVFGNPHSRNPSSLTATTLVEEAREKVLAYFNAGEDYHCIFTANATGALKIVGESYPFNDIGFFLLTLDNHNSVNGIREFARSKGAGFCYTPLNASDLSLNEEELIKHLDAHKEQKNKLFAYPLQSNVSGVKHPLKWIKIAQEKGWNVLADAAAYVPYNSLNLKDIQPDYISISFYKMFGYPTGIGCLLVHKNSFTKLQKPWFAGGTITAVSALGSGHIFDENHARFEDGTLNYLEIPTIKDGLEFIEKTGIDCIRQRVEVLTSFLLTELTSLKHDNQQPMIQLYGPGNIEKRGGTIIFNILDTDGRILPYELIEVLAGAQMISLRTGCFCNPGIDEANNCLLPEELAHFFTMSEKGNYQDMIHFLGKLRGAIRISLGMVANYEDCVALLKFLQTFKNENHQNFLQKYLQNKSNKDSLHG